MKPPSMSVEGLIKARHARAIEPRWAFVGACSYSVYPGWATLHVFRDKEDAELWGWLEFYEEDTGDDPNRVPTWLSVREVVTWELVRREPSCKFHSA